MDSTSDNNTFISNPIKDIIISYLNPHELYIKELKSKINKISEVLLYNGDISYTGKIVVRYNFIWDIGYSWFYAKDLLTNKLHVRSNNLKQIFDIHKSTKYGYRTNINLNATNKCYINY